MPPSVSPTRKEERWIPTNAMPLSRHSGPLQQQIYEALKPGKLSSTDLRQVAGGRSDGMTAEFNRLMEHGLIRLAGREARARGIAPRMFERVPPADIEAQAEKYAARRPKARQRKAGSRLAEIGAVEQGEFQGWHRTRKRILEETQLLTHIEKQAFWESVPEDELAIVLDKKSLSCGNGRTQRSRRSANETPMTRPAPRSRSCS